MREIGKESDAVFCGSDQAAGKCFERDSYMTVLNLFHFHKFSDLKCFFRNLKRFQTLPLV